MALFNFNNKKGPLNALADLFKFKEDIREHQQLKIKQMKQGNTSDLQFKIYKINNDLKHIIQERKSYKEDIQVLYVGIELAETEQFMKEHRAEITIEEKLDYQIFNLNQKSAILLYAQKQVELDKKIENSLNIMEQSIKDYKEMITLENKDHDMQQNQGISL